MLRVPRAGGARLGEPQQCDFVEDADSCTRGRVAAAGRRRALRNWASSDWASIWEMPGFTEFADLGYGFRR